MSTSPQRDNFCDFMRRRFGSNWVLARRTKNIVRQYGADVRCVSHKQYYTAELEYRAINGDPHDPVRADLYRALVKARDHIALHSRAVPEFVAPLLLEIDHALETERNAR